MAANGFATRTQRVNLTVGSALDLPVTLTLGTAETTVLVVRAGEDESPYVSEPIFHHVLLPVDHAAAGSEALQRALSLGTVGRTVYTLLTVVSPIPVLPRPFSDPGVFIADDDSAHRTERARNLLEHVAEHARATGATIDVRVLVDDGAASTILEVATQSGADLIVLPTNPSGPLSRAFLGSVADKVVRGATVPILLVPVSRRRVEET